MVDATITIHNDGGSTEEKYESQPAMFGKSFFTDKVYAAHLQTVSDDAHLCNGHHETYRKIDRNENIRFGNDFGLFGGDGGDGGGNMNGLGGGHGIIVPQDGEPGTKTCVHFKIVLDGF